MVAAILAFQPVAAQESESSSTDAQTSSSVDKKTTEGEPGDLPVSVDRIRNALAEPPSKPLLRGLDERPDFALTVEERVILEDFFRPEDFKVGPVPAGGLYAHEQHRVLSNSVDRPLNEPYAAYSGGELVTLAIQGLLIKYLGQAVVDEVVASRQASEEAAAREKVLKAIQAYCAAQPEGVKAPAICAGPPPPR